MTETNRGTYKEFEVCLQGRVHFFFKVSPSNMELGLNQKQLALGLQRFVYLCEESRSIWDFMHHPERQNEIDLARKPDALSCALMELDSILHAGLLNASLNFGEHCRLNIGRDHTTRSTGHLSQGDGEWSGSAAKFDNSESWFDESAEDFLGFVKPASQRIVDDPRKPGGTDMNVRCSTHG